MASRWRASMLCGSAGPDPDALLCGSDLGVDGGSWSPARTIRPTITVQIRLSGQVVLRSGDPALGETASRLGAPSELGDGSNTSRCATTMWRGWRAISRRSAAPVAWDPGNGATGEVVQLLTARLAGRHILLNEAIDGTFPAHHPDPTIPENLVQLQEVVTAGAAISASLLTATGTGSASSMRAAASCGAIS